jgi:H+-transporting ATPase
MREKAAQPTTQPPPAALARAATASVGDGLTSAEAADRRGRYGSNSVAQMRPDGLRTLLQQFWGLLPGMLELVVLIDLILGKWVEAAVVAALVVLNAIMGFRQKGQAQKALALLRQHLQINSRVRRDGRWQELPAGMLVPDDLVHLRVGDVVPADVHLADGQLEVDQSQLTGESLPIELASGGTAYAGSLISRGEATGTVTATGARTYFGKTADLVRTAEAPRRLERLIVTITAYLGAVVLALALTAFATMIIRGTPLAEMLPFGVMLLVTAVPLGLPMMFTMSAVLGTRALAGNGILVTRLAAIEDAASMDVLCLDKTGTLTENRLAFGSAAGFDGTSADEVLRLAALASDEATQDPIDLAVLKAAGERGLVEAGPRRLVFTPFDPSTKRSEASVQHGDQVLRVVKGAPAPVAALAQASWPEISAEVVRLSADGSRVLAVASGSGSSLRVAGLITLSDPPRPDAAALVARLREQGVRLLLVTGDGEATARAIAARVGITGTVAPAGTLRENLDPQTVDRFEIFAGVYPQEKFYLVQALQKAGHMVGMTGDGVNDAPALRQADVGVAVAKAADVARAAASLVLTKPGLGEIVMAVEGSRRIFKRMQNFVLTMIGMKLSTPIFLALGVILLGVSMLTPLQIALMMFFGNIVTMSVSMDQVIPSPRPDRWAVRPLMATGLGFAALLLLLDSTVFWIGSNVLQLGAAQTQTLVFAWLAVGAGQALLYVTRGRGFFWERPHPGRWHLLATLLDVGVVGAMVTLGWLMAPIPISLFGGVLVLSIGFLIGAGGLKAALTSPRWST